MPTVALARIDDRLIHGQVVIKWLRAVPCSEIVICDDEVRADPFLQRVLNLAKPPGIRLRLLSIDEAIAYLGEAASHDARVMLLVRSPATIEALLDGGIRLDRVNLGGLAGGPGSKRIHRSVSVTEAQLETLRQIQRRGVRVLVQTVPEPEESAVPLESLKL